MRSNKKALICTLIVTSITLLICIILYTLHSKNLIYDLSLAAFGSAMVGIAVAYSAYSAEKRKTMEEFWTEAYRIIRAIKQLEHIDFEVPDDVLYPALNEIQYPDFDETEKTANENKAYKEIGQWYEKNANNFSYMKDDQKEEYCKKEVKRYKKLINKYINQYNSIADIDFHKLNNAYGNMDFVLANRSTRDCAYNNIYKRLLSFSDNCKEAQYHFKQMENGIIHYGVALGKIRELDEQVFSDDGHEVYATMADQLLYALETFRSKIYKIKPEYEKPEPIIIRLMKETIDQCKT